MKSQEKTKSTLLPYYESLGKAIEEKRKYCSEGEIQTLEKTLMEITRRSEQSSVFISKLHQRKDNFILPVIMEELGIDYKNTTPLALICEVVANTILVRSNVLIELVGEQGSGKSHIRENILGIHSQTGTISSAQLFGSKVSHAKVTEHVLLNDEVVFLDEFSLEDNITLNEFKKATTINKFEQSGKFTLPTSTSFALAYNVFENISCLEGTKSLMKILQPSSDIALQDRIIARVPFYKEFLKRAYLDYQNSDLNELLKEFLLSRREINIPSVRNKANSHTKDSRDLRAIINVAEAILLICYLDVEKIPDYAVEGSIEIAKYFRSLTKTNRTQFYNPLTHKSLLFWLKISGVSGTELLEQHCIYDNYDRILFYNANENIIQKIAITEYGVRKNEKEYQASQNGETEYEIKRKDKNCFQVYITLERGFKPFTKYWYSINNNYQVKKLSSEEIKQLDTINSLELALSSSRIQQNCIPKSLELQGFHPLIKLEIAAYLLEEKGIEVHSEDIPVHSVVSHSNQTWKLIGTFWKHENDISE